MHLGEAVRHHTIVRTALLLGLAICAAAPLLQRGFADELQTARSPERQDVGSHAVSHAVSHQRQHEQPRVEPYDVPHELPTEWDGKPLRPLALSAVEQRFAAQFPGRVARLTDGEAVLIWRDVTRPTRRLHPAADCFRALGYRIEHAALEHDAQARLWRCFTAVQGTRRLRVCERIQDAAGASFTDASSWFWAAQLGRSRGPWQAITVTREM